MSQIRFESYFLCFLCYLVILIHPFNRRCTLSEMAISSSTTQNRTGVTYINETFAMFENMGTDELVGLLRVSNLFVFAVASATF